MGMQSEQKTTNCASTRFIVLPAYKKHFSTNQQEGGNKETQPEVLIQLACRRWLTAAVDFNLLDYLTDICAHLTSVGHQTNTLNMKRISDRLTRIFK